MALLSQPGRSGLEVRFLHSLLPYEGPVKVRREFSRLHKASKLTHPEDRRPSSFPFSTHRRSWSGAWLWQCLLRFR